MAVISRVALATTAQAAEWDERQVRFQAANGECLTAFERATDPVVLDRCDTDDLRGDWRMIDDGGDFLLKNRASGQCLDAQGLGHVPDRLQQRYGRPSAAIGQDRGKQVWDIRPTPHACG